jgi:hypothetical protein
MKILNHVYKTPAEAQAFLDGVEYVNDSALTGYIDPNDPCTVITEDKDGRPDEDDDEEGGTTFVFHRERS